MKKVFYIATLLLSAILLQGQFTPPPSSNTPVMADADGVLVAPANFWEANAEDVATAVTGDLGMTTVGEALLTLTPPGEVRFLRINADDTVSALSASDQRTALGLGSAAVEAASAFATSAQGGLADSAVQPGDLPGALVGGLAGYTADRLYDGTPAQREHVLQKLRAIRAGEAQSLMVMNIGDSLASGMSRSMVGRQLQPWFPDPSIVRGRVLGAGPQGSGNGAFYLGVSNPTETRFEKDYYENIFVGTGVIVTDANPVATITYNGSFMSDADRQIIPILVEPGAGTVKVEIRDAGGSWAAPDPSEIVSDHTLTSGELIVDASAAEVGADVIVLEYSAIRPTAVRVTHVSGGPVKLAYPMNEIRSAPAINTYQLSAGSNSFGNETATGAVATSAIIAALEPDIIFIESDDSAADYENFLPLLQSAIFSADLGYTPLVVLVGSAPKQPSWYQPGESKDLRLVARTLRQWAADTGWFFFDGYNIAQTPEQMIELGYAGDGVHPDGGYNAQAAARAAAQIGLAPPVVITDTINGSRDVPTARAIKAYVDPQFAERSIVPQGAYFGGSGASVEVPYAAARPLNFTKFSLSYWGTVDAIASGGAGKTVLGNGRGVSTYYTGAVSLYVNGEGRFAFSNEIDSTTRRISTGVPVGLGVLAFITITVDTDTGDVKIYHDGQLAVTDNMDPIVNTCDSNLFLMHGGDSARWVQGLVRYAAMHDKILSDSEAMALFRSGGWADVGGEVFAYHFTEGVGYQVRDRSANKYDGLASATLPPVWQMPRRQGSLRARGVNVSSGAAQVLSASQDILPAGAVITGVSVVEKASAAADGIVIERSDRSTHSTLVPTQDITADAAAFSSVSGPQNLDHRNIRLQQASSGGSDLDLSISYELAP